MLDTNGTIFASVVGLPGGVTLTVQGTGDVWSYPNLRGEMVATTDDTGTKQGDTLHYDPYGLDLAGIPDNAPGNSDLGWTGQRYTDHGTGFDTIDMGASAYAPRLGRFLETDPIEGGSAMGEPRCLATSSGHAKG